jgi:hypothetical protein
VFGLAKNKRLVKIIGRQLHEAQVEFEQTQKATRVFTEFPYQTRKSWQRERRVAAKAEHLDKGANPRFVVTSLAAEPFTTRALHEELYCARGEMENRITEQQLALFADRTSTEVMRSNQLRLYLSTFAYQLMQGLRRLGLKGTEMPQAQGLVPVCASPRHREPRSYLAGREPVMRMSTSLLALCCQSGLVATVGDADQRPQ